MVGSFVEELEIFSNDLKDMPLPELDAVLSKLPCLKSLRLTELSIPLCLQGESLPGWKTPISLQSLTLDHVYFPSPGWSAKYPAKRVPSRASGMPVDCCFVELINLFGAVRKLTLANTGFNWDAGDDSQYGRYLVNRRLAKIAASNILSSFRVEEIVSSTCIDDDILSIADLLRLLSESASLKSLRRVDISDVESVIHKFLWDVGHTLTHLHLRFNPFCYPLQRQDEYNVGCCTSLEDLQVTMDIDLTGREESEESQQCAYDHLLNVVAKSPRTMRRFVIRMQYFSSDLQKHLDASYLDGLKWSTIDNILTSRKSLKNITFVFVRRYSPRYESPMPPSFEKEIQLIKEQLPRLAKKKILGLGKRCLTENHPIQAG
ncbi:hypothetical protein EIP91_000923 [Steccherinum ochraceum]|uniref:F-box domain-containing protein n=1 Tax=Steccherinum ochraceum TaxID=92696 RepID=A0A4V2MWM0_9APHY|nr:hypothetical protein EIP91_000923 [Steccherinum ochraceum]